MSKQTDLVWIAYKNALNKFILVNYMDLPPTNYIDSITISSFIYHYKNNSLTEEKFYGMKIAWNDFVKERPNGNYTIVGSGDYIINVDILNKFFALDYYNACLMIKKIYNFQNPKKYSSLILPIFFGFLVFALFVKFVVF
jgi:hypothetical protein